MIRQSFEPPCIVVQGGCWWLTIPFPPFCVELNKNKLFNTTFTPRLALFEHKTRHLDGGYPTGIQHFLLIQNVIH